MHVPDPGRDASRDPDELFDEDEARSEVTIGELYERDLRDPTTPDPTEDIELHPEGEEAD